MRIQRWNSGNSSQGDGGLTMLILLGPAAMFLLVPPLIALLLELGGTR
jgi:hypothetical protein